MKRQVLEYSITAGVCLVLGFVLSLFQGLYSQTEVFRVCGILCDCFFIPGTFAFLLGLFIFVGNNGMFDMLAYGFIRFISLFKKNPRDVKYETYYDYSVARAEKPKNDYAFLLIIGGGFILISLVFLLIWANTGGLDPVVVEE